MGQEAKRLLIWYKFGYTIKERQIGVWMHLESFREKLEIFMIKFLSSAL